MLSIFRQNAPRAAARAFSTTTARPLAKMQIIGRLADKPDEFDTSTGRKIVRYALGVSSGPKDENGNRGVSWFRVACFMEDGPQKDLLLSLGKGSQLYVEADARMDTYETKPLEKNQQPEKRTALNLLQRNFEIISSRPRDGEDSDGSE
ncbi:unnamed protein product [Zymoseptoria tritici ST99CH_1E4]|uniref:SsDNA binding protein n=1 Tax=Zymoseptoria tritici ST99CH_1E4 TaxID=1276532 RepID=A0A2H1GTU5_ZYMTR|nr:unnamed protein product [Zymoseptoria tritici ST99CH_1E4]